MARANRIASSVKPDSRSTVLALSGAFVLALTILLGHGPGTLAAPALDSPTATTIVSLTPSSPIPTATPSPREAAIERASVFEGDNDDWKPYIETFTFDNGVSIDLALVPAGCFQMGDDPHVAVYYGGDDGGVQCFDEPFWIGRYEVTNAQYMQCVGAGFCDEPDDNGADFNAPDQPVVGVSWFQARQYVEWLSAISGLSFSLPTEAEWEYAARGPAAWFYPWGDVYDAARLSAGDENGDSMLGATSPVGVFSPAGDSWVGAADMAGNAWEWVSSIYRRYPYDPGDGREDLGEFYAPRGSHGGAWNWRPNFARAALRNAWQPEARLDSQGFRVALHAPPQSE